MEKESSIGGGLGEREGGKVCGGVIYIGRKEWWYDSSLLARFSRQFQSDILGCCDFLRPSSNDGNVLSTNILFNEVVSFG